MTEKSRSNGQQSARGLFESIPEPWRGWIDMRRQRRWMRAVRFARRHNANLAADAPSFNFYPMRLEPTAALAHVAARLGVRIAAFPGPATMSFAWHTGTWVKPADAQRLPVGAVNRACTDVGKTTVDGLWAQVAGYSISVDPRTWQGQMVVKPVRNAVRGGQLVDGPIERTRDDVVYQRLIDSRQGDRIHSTRAAIIGGRVVGAYEKWRPYPHWFKGPELTLPKVPAELYSEDELGRLIRFAELLGLDYGELDVLRDNESGLIYVVDAARTPVRPKGLAKEHQDEWFAPMAAAFEELIRRG